MPVSTENLHELLDIEGILRTSRAIALLDLVLEPEFDLRYFSYNSKWSASEAMASFRNGSGNAYFLLSNGHGAILLAQTPHSALGRQLLEGGIPLPGTFDGVPDVFADALNEAAFSVADTTFCLWRRTEDEAWSVGGDGQADGNGSAEILFALDGRPETYKEWAHDYHGLILPLEVIEQIYEAKPLTLEMVHALNPECTLSDLADDLDEIGYPLSKGLK